VKEKEMAEKSEKQKVKEMIEKSVKQKEKEMVGKSEKQKEKMHCPPEPERRGLCTRPQCMLHGLGVCASGGHGYTKKISRDQRKNSRVW
jgi:hypothetical protein